MNFVDILAIILILILCIRGYLKGFVNEIFSLLIIVLGLTGAFILYRPLGTVFLDFIENTDIALVFAFFSIFILITIFLIILRNILVQFIERLNLTDADSILGIIIGLVKGVLLLGIVLVFLKHHPVFRIDELIGRSFFYPYLESLIVSLVSLLPENAALIMGRILGTV
jgi:membrane protein required for colicin V production